MVAPTRRTTSVDLTPRDQEICTTLATKVVFLEETQIARTWWQNSENRAECASDRLKRLVAAGYLILFKIRVHPERLAERPIVYWQPAYPKPDFEKLSYACRARWDEPLRWVTAYALSPKASHIYAARGGPLSRPLQATHDLHLAAIYLRLFKEKPDEAKAWVSDRILAPLRRGKLPDAEIQDADGRTLKVIEFGGSYGPERVRKVHSDSEKRGVPYELW